MTDFVTGAGAVRIPTALGGSSPKLAEDLKGDHKKGEHDMKATTIASFESASCIVVHFLGPEVFREVSGATPTFMMLLVYLSSCWA